MLTLISDAITSLQLETATYSHNVQIWMKVMAGSFLISILFVRTKPGARLILAALLLNIMGLIIGKIIFADASRTQLGTYVHVLFWPAILWVLIKTESLLLKTIQSPYDWAYVIWLCWACLLMCISLFFDFRTLITLLT